MSEPKIKLSAYKQSKLNDAQLVLNKIVEDYRYTTDTDVTRALVKAEDAIQAVFQFLNSASSYCNVDVPNEVMIEWRNEVLS